MEGFVFVEGEAISTLAMDQRPDLRLSSHVRNFEGMSLAEHWVTVTNAGTGSVRIDRIDSVSFRIPKGNYALMYYQGKWGQEFETVREPLVGEKLLFNRSGRSSQGLHPWFTLFGEDGQVITLSVMWSGNWVIRLQPEEDGGVLISAGLDDWEFYKDLQQGESMESPHVAIAYGQRGDLNETSVQFARAGRTTWYPNNVLMDSLPVEWNHWWSYEDSLITEDAFKKNVDMAVKLGFDICTLDAGWFGPSDSETFWYDYRGDWDLVNTMRFPSGIRSLSDYTHAKGLKFGLWCEIEALGKLSQLSQTHPNLVARRDEEHLGYVCFGNPEGQEWAIQTLDRIITEYRCDWIKLDFNLDPGAGCNRTDHGHGAGDGLFEHYQGYYRVLTRIREMHPNVVLENCSSGGLRLDLGLMQHTHTAFLSDPDWPEHNLQLFWGATTMFAPNVCLHWGYCDWLKDDHPYQKFNPHDGNLTQHQLDYYVRTSMLGGIGYSQKLPELPEWIQARYVHHNQIYKNHVRKFVAHGDCYRLTEQPRREGKGERWAAFQYAMPDQSEHLLFVFRLHNAKPEETIQLKALQPDRTYQLAWLSDDRVEYRTGAQLMEEGLTFTALHEEDSSLILIL